ncbi:MAG: endonuclease/exonuclease/phosphatase family protein [Bacteroidaceae bacterium]|nr:endonuclease/exonuclease/phosphatase family protein [Bacteroidaceae bacterium]
MKKSLILLLTMLLPMMCFSAPKEKTAKLRWGTFNIRLKTTIDDEKGWGWDVRRDRVASYIKKNRIDVVGMQEVLHVQLEDLLARLPEYDYVGVGRTDGKMKGEYSPVFFRKDKFEVLEKGNFWLSETPDVPGSVGWDAALERIASYAKLRDKRSGKVFMAVNTHFDHVGVKARRESAKLIMRKIQEIVGDQPAVVTGDFNVTEDDEAYVTMLGGEMVNGKLVNCKLNDAYHMNAKHTGANYTWHNYCRIPAEKAEKIDFIFLTPTISVKRTHIEQPNPDAMLSDHNPHWADLKF